MKGEKQMIYKNIVFKAAPFSYDLDFDDRITLVGGDSGTGKTVLYEMLEDIRLTDEYKAIKLFNYKSDNFLESIKQCRDNFIVIDNADIMMNDEVRKFINFEFSNQYMLFFEDVLMIESKESNQGLLDAVSDLEIKEDDKCYIAFDYVVDNQDIRNKYRMLRSMAEKSKGKIVILDMICFEYLILAFHKLVAWTGTGKTDKINIRKEILSAVENHSINLSKINDEKTLKYLSGFKRYSTERVMKSLVGELTQNEKWSRIPFA